jgi:hypothetical protein
MEKIRFEIFDETLFFEKKNARAPNEPKKGFISS